MGKRHPLFWLGLLGFLGLLTTFTDKPGYAGLFGFFGFFGFASIKNDERLEMSIYRAARIAMGVGMVGFVIGMLIMPLMDNTMVFAIAFPSMFVLQLLVFTFSVSYYDRAGV